MHEKKCCVPTCSLSRADNAILHLFPDPKKELDRFTKWIYAIGGNLFALDPLHVFKCGRVCNSHFEQKYCTVGKRLSRNAIPSLGLSGINITPRRPLQQLSDQTEGTPLPSAWTLSAHPILSTSQEVAASTSKGICYTSRPPLQDVTNNSAGTLLPALLPPSGRLTICNQTSSSSQVAAVSKDKHKISRMVDANYVMLRNQIKKLQKQKDSATIRLKKALKLSENAAFQKALGKFSPTASIFTNLQFREAGKHKLGCRFTKKEKVMALALYKQGPRAYRWLKKFFILPSPLTLSRMISRASLRPGINNILFKHLQKRVSTMKPLENLCVLLFDEIALTAHFDYSKRTDCISGFVNNGTSTQNKIADHALVFMVRGIHKNYKQTISYTFCQSTTPSLELVFQIKTVIRKLFSIGFNVIATVCDQGATNISAINWLIKNTNDEYLRQGKEIKYRIFEIDGKEIVPLYDPPHLIKGIRNNLITKNLNFKMDGVEKKAKWDHIMQIYQENPAYKGIRLMPKLTERHVVAQKISKMKVKCATQVFSQTVAANMGYLAKMGILSKECEDTADLLLFFDNLFDSVNGSSENFKKRTGKPLLGPVTPNSAHKRVWTEAKKVLKSMRFSSNVRSGLVPSITNWLQTIENMEYIVEVLSKKYNLTSVWMRHFNQDPLENFFGCIRSHGYRNISPSCVGFEAAFASLLINNLSSMHSPGSNCEVDNCINFKSLTKMFFKKSETSGYVVEVNFDHIDSDNIFVDPNLKKQNTKIKAQLEYVCGYVLKQLKISCALCKSSLYDKNRDSEALSYREYDKFKRCLSYPSTSLTNCFSNMQDVVIEILRKYSKMANLKQYIQTILSVVVDYQFINCKDHKEEVIKKIEDISLNFFICNWCKDTNKLLKGYRTDYDEHDEIQQLSIAYNKKKQK